MKSFTKYFRGGFPTFFPCMIVAIFSTVFGWMSDLAAQAPIIKNIQMRQLDQIAISNQDMANICAATISALFNLPITTINVDGLEKGMMLLSSTQPTDSTLLHYKCKIEGKRIIWATGDGPWRTDTSDEQVSFQLTRDEILITVNFPDGSEKLSRFPR